MTFNPNTGIATGSATAEVIATKRQNDSGGFDDYWLIKADWDVTGQAGPFHIQILPDFGAGENSNTLLQFEMFADRGAFAQDWRTIDFSQDTTTDGIGDTVWRFFSTATAPRTLSIDSAEYNGGAQKIICLLYTSPSPRD